MVQTKTRKLEYFKSKRGQQLPQSLNIADSHVLRLNKWISGLGFRVRGLGARVQGLGLRVEGIAYSL